MFKRSLIVKVFSIVALMALGFATQSLATPLKYPAVREWKGQVWITGKDGKRLLLRKPLILREKALIETSLDAQVKVQLDEKKAVIMLGASEVSLPVIGWDRGEAPVLILKEGQIRWQQSVSEKGGFNVALRSDLFEFLAPPGDYILSFDSLKAVAGVKVLDGFMEFAVLNGDESARVQAGQQVFFQGELEGGQIAYDVLLKGKKIPRGRLGALTAIEAAELARLVGADAKAQSAKIHPSSGKVSQSALQKGAICADPSGRFNECSWVCQGNPKKEKTACLTQQAGVSCVRRRCNANGQWAEELALDAEKGSRACKAQPVVGPCDY